MSDKSLAEALLGDVATAALLSFFLSLREGKMRIDPEKLRKEAPHAVKTAEHEATYAGVIAELPDALKKRLLERWMPSLGRNQHADLVLSVKDMAGKDERKKAIELLTYIAHRPTNKDKTKAAVHIKFMKLHEKDYKIVQLLNAAQKLRDEGEKVYDWLKEKLTELDKWLKILPTGTTIRTNAQGFRARAAAARARL
jgi:hypothetical protein